jgi:ribosomal protein S20
MDIGLLIADQNVAATDGKTFERLDPLTGTVATRAAAASAAERARAVTLLDRAARKGLIHRNAAARHKSRLAKAAAS